ncbi:MAG: motility associated factor glycosyltransferase family protein, partial [bacterium]|nr:motility associated factor glycosyltransferase family protein [bacterium]
LTLTLHHNNQNYYLHSKFNPEAEALKLIQKSNLDADHIVVLGLGAGYHLEKLMNMKNQNTRILLVEPDLEIIKHSLKTLDWKPIFTRPDFFYCFGTDPNALAATVQSFLNMPVFDKLEFIELTAEVRFLQNFFNTAKEAMDNEIKTLLYDFKTRLAEDSMVPKNILKNIGGILKTRRVKYLENKFSGTPGFIVSAGPSLDKNILQLKKINNRAVIICVDTALKPLLKKNIHPHFTVTADPSYKNYLHLQGTEEDIRYFLVSDTAISNQVYNDFHPHIFSVSLGKPIFQMIEENIGAVGEIDAWGSVISLALNFAIYLGLEPITFLGQDFAFTGMRNHCRGTSWEDKWLEYTRDLDLMQRKEKQSITGIAKVVETSDIYGNKAVSSDRLMLYKNYLVKILTSVRGKRFINASEGGVLTEIESMPLRRVLEEFVFPREPLDFQGLYKLPVITNNQNKKKLLTFFKAKAAFFKKYRRKLEDMMPRLAQADQLSLQVLAPLLEECEKIKVLLYNNVRNGEIVEMWSQGPIYHFLRKSSKLEGKLVDETNRTEFVQVFEDYFEKLVPMVTGIVESFDAGVRELQ